MSAAADDNLSLSNMVNSDAYSGRMVTSIAIRTKYARGVIHASWDLFEAYGNATEDDPREDFLRQRKHLGTRFFVPEDGSVPISQAIMSAFHPRQRAVIKICQENISTFSRLDNRTQLLLTRRFGKTMTKAWPSFELSPDIPPIARSSAARKAVQAERAELQKLKKVWSIIEGNTKSDPKIEHAILAYQRGKLRHLLAAEKANPNVSRKTILTDWNLMEWSNERGENWTLGPEYIPEEFMVD